MERFDEGLYLTTSQVAELADVHPSTVKRWCNDGDLPYDTTDGGHRRIYLADVLALTGRKGIDTILDHFAPYQAHVWTAIQEAIEEDNYERFRSLALGWLDRGKIERMGWLFREFGRHPRIPFESFGDKAIRSFMAEIGELWRSGALRSGEEHMATEMLVETLLRLRDQGGRSDIAGGATPPVAIVGAMEGDRHHLASLCLRIMLERRGWHVYYLGADVPVEDFAALQRQHRAGLVCVSFAPPNTGADMQRCVRILSEFYNGAHPWTLVLGGAVHPLPKIDVTPFEDFRIFTSLTDFGVALDEGLARSDSGPGETAADSTFSAEA
jgi:excisionase family DNA binding protein